LSAAAAPVAVSVADEEPLSPESEPLRSAISNEAATAFEAIGEIRGGHAISAEVQALNAAVALFGAVFRLQSSDVRQQLLGHLATAASKAASARDTKEVQRFGIVGVLAEKSDKGSTLLNACAALLGSLQRIAQKPPRSALRPELLADGDVAVRRAAAQSVGILGALFGEAFISSFMTDAAGRLSDARTKEDHKAGLAVAVGYALRQAPAMGRLKQGAMLLCSLATGPSSHVAEWSVHALKGVCETYAADFRPFVGGCLGAASNFILATPSPSVRGAQAI